MVTKKKALWASIISGLLIAVFSFIIITEFKSPIMMAVLIGLLVIAYAYWGMRR